MGNMMASTTGMDYGFITLWGLHVLSVIAFFTGVLFLIILAAKTFNARQLKSWAIWLMVLGTIVCLITIALLGRPWVGGVYGHRGMGGMQMMGGMMEKLMEHDRGAGKADQEEHDEMMEMMRMMTGSPKSGGGMMMDASSSN